MIKPIPTHYGGILYRSKLEACWARFFDVLGIGADYEVEGYQLPSGNYLPDFYLHCDGGLWAEVKAREPDDRELDLGHELVEETGHPIVFLVGSPMLAINEYRYPFLLTRYSWDVIHRAIIDAHRSVRWDPNAAPPPAPPVKLPRKVGTAWRRRSA